MSEKRIFGIDLGTTYSCIAYIDEYEKPALAHNPLQTDQYTIPSVVLFETDGKTVVGEEAKGAIESADLRVEFAKRNMGKVENGVPFTYQINGKNYSPHHVSGQILFQLKLNAENALKLPEGAVKDVVITVPAYFGAEEIKATKLAGEIAGLNVLEVISEPTAAVLSSYTSKGVVGNEEKNVVAYDLGGGTFDVTFISLKGGEITEVYTAGNPRLGGKDWDDVLIIIVLEKLCNVQFSQEEVSGLRIQSEMDGRDWQELLIEEMHNKFPGKPFDVEQLLQLRGFCESAKRALTALSKTTVRFNGSAIQITQAEFHERTKDLLDMTRRKFQEVVDAAAERGYSNFDEILLVGGSAKMPQVETMLKEQFNKKMLSTRADLVVAEGAAVYAQYKVGVVTNKVGVATEKPELDVFRICSKSYGTRALDADNNEKVFNIVPRISRVPETWTNSSFVTVVKNQSGIKFEIMQSDSDRTVLEPDQATEIGSGTMLLPKNIEAGTTVQIDFVLTADGDITLIGRCAGQSCEVKAKFAIEMDESEMKIAQKETITNIKNAVQDVLAS